MRGPRWPCCGSSSSSPVYFGFGKDLNSPSAMDVIVDEEKYCKAVLKKKVVMVK